MLKMSFQWPIRAKNGHFSRKRTFHPFQWTMQYLCIDLKDHDIPVFKSRLLCMPAAEFAFSAPSSKQCPLACHHYKVQTPFFWIAWRTTCGRHLLCPSCALQPLLASSFLLPTDSIPPTLLPSLPSQSQQLRSPFSTSGSLLTPSNIWPSTDPFHHHNFCLLDPHSCLMSPHRPIPFLLASFSSFWSFHCISDRSQSLSSALGFHGLLNASLSGSTSLSEGSPSPRPPKRSQTAGAADNPGSVLLLPWNRWWSKIKQSFSLPQHAEQ